MMLKNVKVTYSDGSVIVTNMAEYLTDKEINEYFTPGKVFNIGNVTDNLQKVIKCEILPLRGLSVFVYRNKYDCTNGGISSVCENIILCGEGLPELSEVTEKTPAFKVVRRIISGREYLHVEPINKPDGRGWMFGGNLCYCSDSRFPCDYPLKIHDRQEF